MTERMIANARYRCKPPSKTKMLTLCVGVNNVFLSALCLSISIYSVSSVLSLLWFRSERAEAESGLVLSGSLK